ncbi:uncharacterized protein N7518_003874 [Penicillium psychrosexuale]|uniref:uncharacterized protein n=1 Tax=Penicillium psychrosexuale TaxID=1002107 RepID=UPI0025453CB2|nr:uncharacterized protein N7518_003874 [Penicillium psychrosexuale]KAJ5801806.1 hypothetical protein N7518_003874 [Penicillium psychrosexuale]
MFSTHIQMALMLHRDAFIMENLWNQKSTRDGTPDNIGALTSPKVYRVAEMVPTRDTLVSTANKRLDALAAQLETLRLDGLTTKSQSSRNDPFTITPKASNKSSDHAGLLTQSQTYMPQGANIMADIRAIAEIRDDRKKFRRWKRVFRDHYAVSWDECRVRKGLAMVSTDMIDMFNIRANVRTLSKWRRLKHRPQRRHIQRICDPWIDSCRLWALYDS